MNQVSNTEDLLVLFWANSFDKAVRSPFPTANLTAALAGQLLAMATITGVCKYIEFKGCTVKD